MPAVATKRKRKIHGLYFHSSPPKVVYPFTMSSQMKPKTKDDASNNKEAFIIKPSSIRIWIHDKDIHKLTKVLWEGQGNRLRTEVSSNHKVKKFLEAVPFIMNIIKDIHSATIDNNLETIVDKTSPPVPQNILASKDANGLTPLHKAAGLSHTSIVAYILEAWPTAASELDATGKTPLHWAASAKNNSRSYDLLVQAGSDEQALDYKMKTPNYYKNKPTDIDRSLLTIIPDAPRIPHHNLPTGFEWNMLGEDINAATITTDHTNNVKKSQSNYDNYSLSNDEPLSPQQQQPPPPIRRSSSEDIRNGRILPTTLSNTKSADKIVDNDVNDSGADDDGGDDDDDEQLGNKISVEEEAVLAAIHSNDVKLFKRVKTPKSEKLVMKSDDTTSNNNNNNNNNNNETEIDIESDTDKTDLNEKVTEIDDDQADDENVVLSDTIKELNILNESTTTTNNNDDADDIIKDIKNDELTEFHVDKDNTTSDDIKNEENENINDNEKDNNNNNNNNNKGLHNDVDDNDKANDDDDDDGDDDKDVDYHHNKYENEADDINIDEATDFGHTAIETGTINDENYDARNEDNIDENKNVESIDNDKKDDGDDNATNNVTHNIIDNDIDENNTIDNNNNNTIDNNNNNTIDNNNNNTIDNNNNNNIEVIETNKNDKENVNDVDDIDIDNDKIDDDDTNNKNNNNNDNNDSKKDNDNDNDNDKNKHSENNNEDDADSGSVGKITIDQHVDNHDITNDDHDDDDDEAKPKTTNDDEITKNKVDGKNNEQHDNDGDNNKSNNNDDDDDDDDETSPSPPMEINGIVTGEPDNGAIPLEGANYPPDDINEETDDVQQIIDSGDMEQLATLVLNGEGRKLIGMTTKHTEIQAFLDNVPAYMNKIRRVHLAAREGSLRDLQSALDRRKFAIAKDDVSPFGATPLHVATIFGHAGVVRYLGGRFPETTTATDDNGRTALHYAATINDNGHFYNLLMHMGANVKAEDNFGHSAEFYFNHEQSDDILSHRELLKHFGAQEELVNEMLSDQVPDDAHSARRLLDDADILSTLERCYRLIHSPNNKHRNSSTVELPSNSVPGSASSIRISVTTYLARFLKRSIFDRIKFRQTRLDHNLFDIIWPAMKRATKESTIDEDLNAGVIAPDFDVYVVFQEFLVPLIKDIHCMDLNSEFYQHPKLQYFPNFNLKQFTNNDEDDDTGANDDGGDSIADVNNNNNNNVTNPMNNNYIKLNLDTTGKWITECIVECSRNLDTFELPLNLNVGQLENVERIITEKIVNIEFSKCINETDIGIYYSMNEILENPSEIRTILAAHNLLIPLLTDATDSYQMAECITINGKYWPYGRGVYVSNNGDLAIWINVQEHLRVLCCTESQKPGDIGYAYSKIGKVMEYLETILMFRHSYFLGYLAAYPSFLGTSLHIHLKLELPHLLKEKENLRHLCTVRGLHMRSHEHQQSVVTVCNMQCMGITEWNIFQDYCTAVANIIQLEKDLSMANTKHIAAMLVNIFRKKKNSLVDA